MAGYILGIGAANVDLCGTSTGPIVMEDSNPGHFSLSSGGVTRNICENAARLGANVKLITVLGTDSYADIISNSCKEAGIDLSNTVVLPKYNSSSYLSIHDSTGEMVVAMSDMSILQQLSPQHLKAREDIIENAGAIIIDGGLPQTVIDFIRLNYGSTIPIFADPVSTTYAHKFCHDLSGIHTIKPNIIEAEILADMPIRSNSDLAIAAQKILALGARRTVITMGKNGAYYCEREGFCATYPAPKTTVINATGAGDSFTGALIYAFVHGFDSDKQMDFAIQAAIAALSHEHTINPHLRDYLRKAGLL